MSCSNRSASIYSSGGTGAAAEAYSKHHTQGDSLKLKTVEIRKSSTDVTLVIWHCPASGFLLSRGVFNLQVGQ